ncbi:MAG TPA: hypothetical protein VMM56_01780, partial [Planctomycetaceae bacterium]|nr:hypothetical protein [Planctomycetaceae bacterium]
GFRDCGTSAFWNEEMIGPEFEMGAILSPRPGVMIVREKEPILLEIKRILDDYRFVRQKSENQKRKDPADEILTRYYRIQTDVANDLEQGLPLIVAPGSWVSESNPDGPGQVLLKVTSPAVVQSLDKWYTGKKSETPETEETTSFSVLVIRHQRKVHKQIETIFERIKKGDQQLEADRLGRYLSRFAQGGI